MSKLWEGEDLHDKVLWVTAEQGLGDEILFSSMIGDLMKRCAVVWEADKRLHSLFRRSYPDVAFVDRGSRVPDNADFHCPAGNLGRYLRASAADFPARQSYLRARINDGHRHYRAFGDHALGISWASGNPKVGQHKTIPLDQWSPILDIPGATFVDLQYGDTADERKGHPIHHVDGLDLTNDIDGVAALIWACEAVVTVSNTVAHLAGALGVPAYVMVPSGFGRFWYWGNGESTPWYPTVRVIRYANGEGGAAIRGVAERLAA